MDASNSSGTGFDYSGSSEEIANPENQWALSEQIIPQSESQSQAAYGEAIFPMRWTEYVSKAAEEALPEAWKRTKFFAENTFNKLIDYTNANPDDFDQHIGMTGAMDKFQKPFDIQQTEIAPESKIISAEELNKKYKTNEITTAMPDYMVEKFLALRDTARKNEFIMQLDGGMPITAGFVGGAAGLIEPSNLAITLATNALLPGSSLLKIGINNLVLSAASSAFTGVAKEQATGVEYTPEQAVTETALGTAFGTSIGLLGKHFEAKAQMRTNVLKELEIKNKIKDIVDADKLENIEHQELLPVEREAIDPNDFDEPLATNEEALRYEMARTDGPMPEEQLVLKELLLDVPEEVQNKVMTKVQLVAESNAKLNLGDIIKDSQSIANKEKLEILIQDLGDKVFVEGEDSATKLIVPDNAETHIDTEGNITTIFKNDNEGHINKSLLKNESNVKFVELEVNPETKTPIGFLKGSSVLEFLVGYRDSIKLLQDFKTEKEAFNYLTLSGKHKAKFKEFLKNTELKGISFDNNKEFHIHGNDPTQHIKKFYELDITDKTKIIDAAHVQDQLPKQLEKHPMFGGTEEDIKQVHENSKLEELKDDETVKIESEFTEAHESVKMIIENSSNPNTKVALQELVDNMKTSDGLFELEHTIKKAVLACIKGGGK